MSTTKYITPRQARILKLRSAGMSNERIAERLNISLGAVRRDILLMHRQPIPGVTTGEEEKPGNRMIYTLGLLHAGVDPKDVPKFLAKLTEDCSPQTS